MSKGIGAPDRNPFWISQGSARSSTERFRRVRACFHRYRGSVAVAASNALISNGVASR
jgi:hypothetical protein